MIIHLCTKCNQISINRIAGDDNPDALDDAGSFGVEQNGSLTCRDLKPVGVPTSGVVRRNLEKATRRIVEQMIERTVLRCLGTAANGPEKQRRDQRVRGSADVSAIRQHGERQVTRGGCGAGRRGAKILRNFSLQTVRDPPIQTLSFRNSRDRDLAVQLWIEPQDKTTRPPTHHLPTHRSRLSTLPLIASANSPLSTANFPLTRT